MKMVRPYIPLSVRVQVAERQVRMLGDAEWWRTYDWMSEGLSDGKKLFQLLIRLEQHLGEVLQLDHDPALILRKFNHRTGKYAPDANDPNHLIYREKAEHQHKTTGRKPGAERTVTTKGSDIWLKTKFKRLENPSKRRKQKIPSRPFSTKRRGSRSWGKKGSS